MVGVQETAHSLRSDSEGSGSPLCCAAQPMTKFEFDQNSARETRLRRARGSSVNNRTLLLWWPWTCCLLFPPCTNPPCQYRRKSRLLRQHWLSAV